MRYSRSHSGIFLFFILALGTTQTQAAKSVHEKTRIPKDVDLVHETYLPVVDKLPFDDTRKQDIRNKPDTVTAQKTLLQTRYDLSDNPSDIKIAGCQAPCRPFPY